VLYEHYVVVVVADCIRWTSYSPQNSVNAVNTATYSTLTDCLEYCASQSRCVAVDFDSSAAPCWLHFNASDLLPENTYAVPGTTQFIISRQCSSDCELCIGFNTVYSILCKCNEA